MLSPPGAEEGPAFSGAPRVDPLQDRAHTEMKYTCMDHEVLKFSMKIS